MRGDNLVVREHHDGLVIGRAVFDSTETYRYLLERRWDAALPRCGFIMLNPSIATESVLDPTIRRCIGFARSWSCGAVLIGNLFAFRATDPSKLRKVSDPIGPRNDEALREVVRDSTMVVAGWGNHGGLHGRSGAVRSLLSADRVDPLMHLGLTASGEPRHPLYLPTDAFPTTWRRGE